MFVSLIEGRGIIGCVGISLPVGAERCISLLQDKIGHQSGRMSYPKTHQTRKIL